MPLSATFDNCTNFGIETKARVLGGYTITGSFGQPDAGVTLSGGEFSLAGGLWGAGGVIDHLKFVPLVMR